MTTKIHNAWTEEARRKSLESRRRHAHSQQPMLPGQGMYPPGYQTRTAGDRVADAATQFGVDAALIGAMLFAGGKARRFSKFLMGARRGPVAAEVAEQVVRSKTARRAAGRAAKMGKKIVKGLRRAKPLSQAVIPLGNAFCPTGEGGGQDNSCSPTKEGLKKGAKYAAGAAIGMTTAAGTEIGRHYLRKVLGKQLAEGHFKKKAALVILELSKIPMHILAAKLGQYFARKAIGEEAGKTALAGHAGVALGIVGAKFGSDVALDKHLSTFQAKVKGKFRHSLDRALSSTTLVDPVKWLASRTGSKRVHIVLGPEDLAKVKGLTKLERFGLTSQVAEGGRTRMAFAYRTKSGTEIIFLPSIGGKVPESILGHEYGHLKDFRSKKMKDWEQSIIGQVTGKQYSREQRAWKIGGYAPEPGTLDSYAAARKGARIGAASGATMGFLGTLFGQEEKKKNKPTTNAWSEEARKASIEARKRKSHGPAQGLENPAQGSVGVGQRMRTAMKKLPPPPGRWVNKSPKPAEETGWQKTKRLAKDWGPEAAIIASGFLPFGGAISGAASMAYTKASGHATKPKKNEGWGGMAKRLAGDYGLDAAFIALSVVPGASAGLRLLAKGAGKGLAAGARGAGRLSGATKLAGKIAGSKAGQAIAKAIPKAAEAAPKQLPNRVQRSTLSKAVRTATAPFKRYSAWATRIEQRSHRAMRKGAKRLAKTASKAVGLA